MRPLRNLVLVERMPDLGCIQTDGGETMTTGGIILPTTFKARGPNERLNAKRDFWRARVVAVGPDVREIAKDDEVLVHTWSARADGTHESLYTGTPVGDGRLLVAYPDDLVCALDLEAAPVTLRERDPFPESQPYRSPARVGSEA